METLELPEELTLALRQSIEKRGIEGTIQRLRLPGRPDKIGEILNLWEYPGSETNRIIRVYARIADLSKSSRYRLYKKAKYDLRVLIDKIEKGVPLTEIISLDDLRDS